ncbi:F-box/kelch-repeat protein At3g06240-like [Papaver somniferum]|uniref:F-box/kelch-repeat protein At3g06240-like n=1 Tax=Papaver somniferum TaxID=3469 RepID=UPI000E6FFA6A|nr:F-box/kelch-repeat protein At3g06240-like [Papaver somniferum]
MAIIPQDIIIDILSMLPIKSISRFRCVCKPWYDLFKNSKFIKIHHHRAIQNNKVSVLLASYTGSGIYYDVYYTIDFDVTSSSHHMITQTDLPRHTYVPNDLLIDSCDGLIGLSTGIDPSWTKLIKMICLWNPLTREYKKISIPTLINNKCWDVCSRYGVCYDWRIDDYKLFRTVVKDDSCSEVWVCRLGSNSWEKIGDMPYDMYPYDFNNTELPLKPLNGIINWMGKNKVIISFDIVEELTKEIKIPSCFLDDELYSFYGMEVGVVGEDLSVNPSSCKGDPTVGDEKLWSYGFLDPDFKPFGWKYDEDSDEDEEDSGEDGLVIYDLINGSLTNLDIPNMPKHFSPTIFVGSLVSLNSGEFVEATQISKVV